MGFMITTVDNPYDPRTDFGAWYMWDTGHGYNTSSYLARIAVVADEFPEPVQDRMIEEAIDEIIDMHNGGLYKKLPVDMPNNEDKEDAPSTPSSSAA
jgi:hypothetical protein